MRNYTTSVSFFLVFIVHAVIAYPAVEDTVIYLNKRPVAVLTPPTAIKGIILLLPGWNFTRMDVCNKSSFCTKALAAGYCLILPEMGKSIYASVSYPETRKDWLGYPQLGFLTDTLILYFQQHFNYLKQGGNNFIYGISTGARGVAQLLIHTKHIFKAGVALSGDYDQCLHPTDKLMEGWYGSYENNTQRWQTVDNPSANSKKIKVPIYFGHGDADKVVDPQYSLLFFKKLKQTAPRLEHQLHIVKGAGHDYIFWDTETTTVLQFLYQQEGVNSYKH